MKSAPAIALDLVPSRRLALGAVVVVVLALLAIAASALPVWLGLVLAIGLVIHAIVTLRRFLSPRWSRLARDSGGWQLADREHETAVAELRHHARLGPLVVLAFDVPGHRAFRFVVDRVAVNADDWRRLVLTLAREPLRP
ncbi:MAG TPA: hypothetical protein PKO41_10955 [Dokdonella sp.]|uniref:protein YgfX n=1 Tax=Dokdonella sp. TaxID=2291710 RepID=UPI0025C07ADC|nr:protein YgfX [Dokdonella sp.]MBX3692608.1 hypothetical protein [Dokdonella sp.]HNR92926.1 hypothetical protein [Dokdonella sp.]